MFEIMYLICLAFVVVIAVAVNIYEIKVRRDMENAFWRECEESNSAQKESNRLAGEKLALQDNINRLQNKNALLVTDNTELRRQLHEMHEHEHSFSRKLGEYMAANDALRERNFDDMMSLFESTIGEDGKEYYEKDGICLIVENGKCVGYYRPHGADACESEERAEEGASYEPPMAEVVEAEEE